MNVYLVMPQYTHRSANFFPSWTSEGVENRFVWRIEPMTVSSQAGRWGGPEISLRLRPGRLRQDRTQASLSTAFVEISSGMWTDIYQTSVH